MARTITVIPPTINPLTRVPAASIEKRKVAAYARVSTDSEEQLTSYEAQIDYYTKYINQNREWQFVKVYTDEGITATNTKRRDGFNEMVADALAGKIDLIVTKSVSRFARNTVDSLTTVRELKAHGVEVYFEKENIYTFDGKGELLITIMSSLAQEESRSISENVTWGQRKRFADGKVTMPFKHFLGYDRGEDGVPVINEKEAEVVRLIYSLFLHGKTAVGICRHLPMYNGHRYQAIHLHAHSHFTDESDYEVDFADKLNAEGVRNEIYNVGCMYWNYEPVTLDEIIVHGKTIRPNYGTRVAESRSDTEDVEIL